MACCSLQNLTHWQKQSSFLLTAQLPSILEVTPSYLQGPAAG